MKQLNASKLRVLKSADLKSHHLSMTSAEILKRFGPPRRLLSTSSKVEKCREFGSLVRVLYLTPGVFCPYASKGCRNACLGHTSGRMGFPSHVAARDRRTALFVQQPLLFLKRLYAELTLLETDALQHDLVPAVRLNGTSDLEWELLYPSLFSDFRNIQFYDYTKSYRRILGFLDCVFPTNYSLTYSTDYRNNQQASDVLLRGGTVTSVFWPELPNTWNGVPVIDGDLHDARFLDPQSVIVGLRAKGLARVDTTGFVNRHCKACNPGRPTLDLVSVAEDSHRTTTHCCTSCGAELNSRWKLPTCPDSNSSQLKKAF